MLPLIPLLWIGGGIVGLIALIAGNSSDEDSKSSKKAQPINFIILMGDTGAGKTEVCHCLKNFDNLEQAGDSNAYETPPGKLVPQIITFKNNAGNSCGAFLLDYSGKDDAFNSYKTYIGKQLRYVRSKMPSCPFRIYVYYVIDLEACGNNESVVETSRRMACDLDEFNQMLDGISKAPETSVEDERIFQPIFSHKDLVKPEELTPRVESLRHELGDRRIIGRMEKWNIRQPICADLKSFPGRKEFRSQLLCRIK